MISARSPGLDDQEFAIVQKAFAIFMVATETHHAAIQIYAEAAA